MKAFIIMTLLMFSSSAFSKPVDCNKHKVYCAITKLNPKMVKSKAMRLSNVIYKYANKIKVDPLRVIAIVQQESSFRNVLVTNTTIRSVCYDNRQCTNKTIETATDIGYYQFHVRTIDDRGLDLERIYSDFNYATEQMMILLKHKIKLCGKKYPSTAWACYHSATPKYHKKYVKMVNRYYLQIKGD